ncbi:MAG: hypothetical protein V3T88_00125 [Nitrosomonadaceae bacterium]
MATYTELRDLFNDGDLTNKVAVALIIAVNDLLLGTPDAADRLYAARVFANPQSEARAVLMAVLAGNSSATVVQITGATDAAIQTKVDAVVPQLVDALAGV